MIPLVTPPNTNSPSPAATAAAAATSNRGGRGSDYPFSSNALTAAAAAAAAAANQPSPVPKIKASLRAIKTQLIATSLEIVIFPLLMLVPQDSVRDLLSNSLSMLLRFWVPLATITLNFENMKDMAKQFFF